MVRETSGVPYIFGHRAAADRHFPEIVGIAEAVIPYHGSPRAKAVAASGHAMRRVIIDLAVRRTGLPERWLEGLALNVVEADGRVVIETQPCLILDERVGKDGYVHLKVHSTPFAVSDLILSAEAKIVLRSSSGHEWSSPIRPLLRAA